MVKDGNVKSSLSPSSDPLFEIIVGLEGEEITFTSSESELRKELHELVKGRLSSKEYERFQLKGRFPPPEYGLRGMTTWGSRNKMAEDIHGYLDQLGNVLAEASFPSDLNQEVMSFFNAKLDDQFGNDSPASASMNVDLHLATDLDRVYKTCTPPASPKGNASAKSASGSKAIFNPRIDPFAAGDPFDGAPVGAQPARASAPPIDPFGDNPFADSGDLGDNPFF